MSDLFTLKIRCPKCRAQLIGGQPTHEPLCPLKACLWIRMAGELVPLEVSANDRFSSRDSETHGPFVEPIDSQD